MPVLCPSPLAICEWSCFSTSSPAFAGVAVFYFSHSDSYVFISHGGFNLHFLNVASFHELIAVSMPSSVKCFSVSFAHFPTGLRAFFAVEFWILVLWWIWDLQIFSPLCRLSFHSLNRVFHREVKFWGVKCIKFYFSRLCFWYQG